MAEDAMTAGPVACVWDLKAELGEGPNWVDREQALWFTDIKKLSLHRFDPATGSSTTSEAGSFPGFVLPAAGGGFVAGLQIGLAFFDPVSGGYDTMVRVEPDLPGNRLNDAAVDASGHLWFGTMDNAEEAPSGRFYRLGDDGSVEARGPGCCITNGPAFSPDGRLGYFVDTLAKRVHVIEVGPGGTLGEPRLFCEIEEGAGYPDGPSVDAEGNVWLGLYGGWGARRYSPAGELLEHVRFPVANVTKIALGGPDLKTAFATTARQGLSAAEIEAQPLAGGLFTFRVDVPGLPTREITAGL
jgi:xylono-1,5-lactonase